VFFALGGAFGVTGGAPGGEFGGVAGVFVFDEDVEFLDEPGGVGLGRSWVVFVVLVYGIWNSRFHAVFGAFSETLLDR